MIDRQELWEMAGFEGNYNTEHVFNLIKSLTKSETYKKRNEKRVDTST